MPEHHVHNVLVTGASGFVGQQLIHSFSGCGFDTLGVDIHSGVDMRNYDAVRNVLQEFRPDWIFHLAAVSTPRESLVDPRRTFDVNVGGTLNLLEAMRATGSRADLLVAGSADEYGPGDRDVDESSACFPQTPYAVSKLAAGALALSYRVRYGMKVVVTRAGNHIGPGRRSVSVAADFARRVVAAERGEIDIISHGPLDIEVDFTDVSDVIDAYRLLIGRDGIWNVCSGRRVALKDLLDIMMSDGRVPVGVALWEDPTLGAHKRASAPRLSNAKLAGLGWDAGVPLEHTVHDLLEYWREQP